MNFTKSGRLARQLRRVKKFVKKSREAKRFVLTMIAVWLVVPALSVKAADDSIGQIGSALPELQQGRPVEINVKIGPALQSEQPTFAVEVRQSPRQITARQAEIKRVAVKVATVSASDGEKRLWVQKAAEQWGIDWKLLEAVWQVESGKQFYTAVRSYAGAQGPLQFMPGTWRAYAQDGNGDGIRDVLDARDSLFGAAKLLAANGAASGNIDGALLRYNHSLSYVTKVKRLAAAIDG